MRVIAGTARGRRLVAPAGSKVRPTSDRVKEALFSSLQARLRGAAVLDLYAGSGALGIEALSRGAGRAVLVDQWPAARKAIETNLAAADVTDRAEVIGADVAAALATFDETFDLVFLDPPYDVDGATLTDVLGRVVRVVGPGGMVVVERATRSGPVTWPDGLEEDRTRRYGDTTLHLATVPDIDDRSGGHP